MDNFFICFLINVQLFLAVHGQTDCKTTADIVFMVDSSQSIRDYAEQDNWQIVKNFIRNVTHHLPVRDDGIRIGVVKFSTTVDTEDIIHLGQYDSKEDLKNRISNLKFVSGGTNTSGVIRHIYKGDGMFGSPSDRDGVQNYGILITDGLSNIDSGMTKIEARKARLDNKIKLFTIGITELANEDELQEIASDPVSHYHFLSQDFQHLNLLIDELLLRLCREKPPPSAPCIDGRADVTFVLDSSGSIGSYSWEILKRFVVAVIDSLDLGSSMTRVGIIRYSTNAQIVFPLNKYFGEQSILSLQDMREEILDLTHLDDRTNISGALRLMRTQMFTEEMGDRPDIQNIGILISDGKSTEEINQTSIEATKTKEAGIRMFALGLTMDIDDNELKAIASTPLTDHYLNTTTIADVGTLKSRLIWGLCNDKCGVDNVSPECLRNVSSYGCGKEELPRWVSFPGHILLGHNYDRLEDIASPEECQRLCYKDPQCRSVDYVTRFRQCAVSYITRAEATSSFVRESSADYYELSCSTFGAGPTGPTMSGTITTDPTATKVTKSNDASRAHHGYHTMLTVLLVEFVFWRITIC